MSNNHTLSTACVTLLPSGTQFDVPPNRSLLEAGLSAGIALPFGCSNGTCGECKARACMGEIQKLRHHEFTLTAAEKLNGVCLLCSYSVVDDAQIEVIEATSINDIPFQQLPARLCRRESSGGTLIVAFKFSRGKALRFLPGQTAQLTDADGISINLPIASCPCNAHVLEFHLPRDHQNDAHYAEFSKKLIAGSSRQRVHISGPSGQFTLSKDAQAPKLFMVEGGEFGQMQGMIEQLFNHELPAPCCLVWRRTAHTEHYQHNLCRSWHDAFDEFHYAPLDTGECALTGIPMHWSTLVSRAEVYLGNADPSLIEALMKRGIQQSRIFYPDPAN